MVARTILGIHGSPCLDGTTSKLLDSVLEGARQAGARTERLDLASMKVAPCQQCRECDSGKGCALHDDDMVTIHRKIREVDGIVLASPIYFMSVTAQTKAMIDRCQCFWIEKYVLKKSVYKGRRRPRGLFVSCAGSSEKIVFEPAVHVAKAFFAAVDYEYVGEVLLGNTDDKDLKSRMPSAVNSAKAAGRKLCE